MSFKRVSIGVWAFLLLAAGTSAFSQSIDSVTQQGTARADENARAQNQVNSVSTQIDDLVSQYREMTKIVDGLKVFNGLLQRQIENQQSEMQYLETSMDNVALIERQIIPLMMKMIDSLDLFVEADVPFLLDERKARVQRLRDLMERSDVTAAEKFRVVVEAYQIEGEYGRTIEAYKDTLEVEGKTREVDMLKIGRVSLAYQTPDGEYSGAWSNADGAFVQVPDSEYKNHIAQGLRIARKEIAPDLLVVPVAAAQEVGQ